MNINYIRAVHCKSGIPSFWKVLCCHIERVVFIFLWLNKRRELWLVNITNTYNPRQKCWEGLFFLSTLPPYSMLRYAKKLQ